MHMEIKSPITSMKFPSEYGKLASQSQSCQQLTLLYPTHERYFLEFSYRTCTFNCMARHKFLTGKLGLYKFEPHWNNNSVCSWFNPLYSRNTNLKGFCNYVASLYWLSYLNLSNWFITCRDYDSLSKENVFQNNKLVSYGLIPSSTNYCWNRYRAPHEDIIPMLTSSQIGLYCIYPFI